MAENVKLFLSCVSDEFGAEREALRHELTGLTVDVAIQEDFVALGVSTLAKVDAYIQQCDVVVHLAGDMAGAAPRPASVDGFLIGQPKLVADLAENGMPQQALAALTYTQWEAWLAIAYGKPLLIAAPTSGAPRGPKFEPDDGSRAAQAAHLEGLRRLANYPEVKFASRDQFVKDVFKSLFAIAGDRIRPARQPRNLPFASIGPLFVGRSKALEDLRAALTSAPSKSLSVRVINGLGGIGKTRLAIEYAWAHAGDYSALLLVGASDAAALNAGLAALARAEFLDLPEKEAREDAVKIEAVLRWLEAHPTWLLILDNVDDEQAVGAVSKLLARLTGGHVIVTARASNFPAALATLELDALDENSATQFLLERTRGKRVEAAEDETRAHEIARELGGLALGLEQAGAYVSKQRIPFSRYLKRWSENREKALAWSDATLMGSEKTLATTWITSVDRLSPVSRRLLDRLALLTPDPIPESLFDLPVRGEAPEYDAYEARAGLADYSLITQAKSDSGVAQGFIVHRLVQDFARRAMSEERRAAALREALGWIDSGFVGVPWDIASWPALDPLAPHALAIAGRAEGVNISRPTARLLSQLGLLFQSKARFVEAEALYRRALAIEMGSNETQAVAKILISLTDLLRTSNRLTEAEETGRQAVELLAGDPMQDPAALAQALDNLGIVLKDTGQHLEALLLVRKALDIEIASHGEDDPMVAYRLNNLGTLLYEMGRRGEAEACLRRAVQIDDANRRSNTPDGAIRLGTLADIIADRRPQEAEALLRQALAIQEAHLGRDHPNVAYRLNNLAVLVGRDGRLDEAEKFMRQALAIFEARLGADHPNTVALNANLAGLLAQRGQASPAGSPKTGP